MIRIRSTYNPEGDRLSFNEQVDHLTKESKRLEMTPERYSLHSDILESFRGQVSNKNFLSTIEGVKLSSKIIKSNRLINKV